MNERQREYFRRKLLAWKEDILRESRERLSFCKMITKISQISPIARHRKRTARSNFALATGSAN